MANEKNVSVSEIIGRLQSASITQEEREIAAMVDAALQQNIILDASCLGADSCYYRFTLGKSDKKEEYIVCFGCDPDRGRYPRAERALRASRFVDRLLKVVNEVYNCYVSVPNQILPPEASDVRRRLFGGRNGILLGEGETVGGDAAEDSAYCMSYELEMVIILAMGNKYERINECVTVELDKQNNAKYTYGSITDKTVSVDMPLTDEQKKESISAANRIRSIMQRAGEKKKILAALSASKESRLRRFMDSLDENDTHYIGQVDIHPCFVFVDAIPERTFLYPVNGVKGLLRVTWNKTPHEFSSASLYIRTAREEGQLRFHGLTHSPKGGAGEELHALDKDEFLVPVYRYDAKRKGIFPVGLSPVVQNGENTPVYKGLSDWGVLVDGISDALLSGDANKTAQGYYYYRSETVMVGDKRYLKEDVAPCGYTGNPMWRGNLSGIEVSYLDASGEFAKGRIDRTLICEKNRHTCEYCGKNFTFYADAERYERYRRSKKYLLWDGNCKCPQCREGVVVKKRKLITAYDPNESATKQVYAMWNERENAPVSIEQGGNVYRCAQSGNFVYYDADSTATQYVPCETCGRFLSLKSNLLLQKDINKRQINGKTYCKACLENMILYKDVYLPGGQKGVLVDAKESPAGLVTCKCGKLLYKQADGFPRCECAGWCVDGQGMAKKVYLCNTCWSKREHSDFLNKRLCDDCAEYERNNYSVLRREQALASQTAAETVDIRRQMKALEERCWELRQNWAQTVWEQMDRYLPYLGFSDALYISRIRKKRRAEMRVAEREASAAKAKLEQLKREAAKNKNAAGEGEELQKQGVATAREIETALKETQKALDAAQSKMETLKRMPTGLLKVDVKDERVLEKQGKTPDEKALYLSFFLRVMRNGIGGRRYEFLYENGKVTYVEVKA